MTSPVHEPTIDVLRSDDTEALAALTYASFGRSVSRAYYEWKYFDNPEGPAVAYVARANDGSLAGLYAVIPEAYYIRGRRTRLYQSCDTMTHPDFRRRGLFERLAERTYAEINSRGEELLKGFAGEMSFQGFVKKLRWALIERIKPRFKVRLHLIVEALWSQPLPASYRFEEAVEIPPDVQEIAEESAATSPIWKVRDLPYLTWRLRDPRADHRITLCFEGDRLVGYYHYCLEDSLLLIRDMLWRQSMPHVAGLLIRHAERMALSSGSKGIYSWTNSGSQFEQLLRRHRFVVNPFSRGPMVTPLFFIVRTSGQIAPHELVANPRSWNLLPIDYDF